MTVREALGELKLSLGLLAVAAVALGIAAYLMLTHGSPASSHCFAFRKTGYFCGSDKVAFWWVATLFTFVCSFAAAVLAALEGVDAFPEEKRVAYTVAGVSLVPLGALIAIAIAAS